MSVIGLLAGLLLAFCLPGFAAESSETLDTFRASFEKRLNAELDEYGQKARTLREGYLEALQNLKAQLGRQDNLKAAAQVVVEIDAIEDGDAAALPEDADQGLQRLRKTWDEGLEKILAERGEKTATTAKLYLKALDTEKRKLTRAGKIKEALLFEEEEKRVKELPEVVAADQAPENEEGDLALASRGATAAGVEEAERLIDGRTARSNATGFAWAKIPCQMTVALNAVHELEQIRFLLWDRDDRIYRYRLEVSEDGAQWETIRDTSRSGASGWQDIKFKARAVRQIRIVGLGNSANRIFHVVEVEAYRTAR